MPITCPCRELEELRQFKATVKPMLPPCKIGDTVWGIRKNGTGIKAASGKVFQMYYGEDMSICICVKGVSRGRWGEKVFPTKEDAEKAIERYKAREKERDHD